MLRVGLLLLVLLLGGCNTLRLGTPAPDAAPTAVSAPPLERLWERNVNAGFGPAAPLVLGEHVLVGTREGDVVLLDAETGAVDGRQSFGDSVEGPLAFSAGRRLLYVASALPGQVIAHDLVRGERAWRWKSRDLGTPDAGVVHVRGHVVAPLSDGHIVGLDATDGARRWLVRPDSTARFVAPPVVVDDVVVVVDDRGQVRRIDPAAGTVQSTVSVGGAVEHAPTVAGGLLVVPRTDGYLVAVDLAAMATRWRVPFSESARVPPRVGPPAAAAVGGRAHIVAGATNGRTVAVDAATGRVAWVRDFDAHANGTPLVSGGFVYIGTTDQRVLALDAASGETRWETSVRGRVKSGLAAADGVLFVLTEPRHVVAFGPPTQ